MEKNLKYYMDLPYVVEIIPIPADEGGGIMARIPLFGILGIVGDGDSIDEALANLAITKEIVLSELIKNNKVIPEPASQKDKDSEEYSGKILTRLPKWLHQKLAISAASNDSSLNQYMVSLLASALEQDLSLARYEEINKNIISMCENVNEIKSKIISSYTMNVNSIGNSYSDEYQKAA